MTNSVAPFTTARSRLCFSIEYEQFDPHTTVSVGREVGFCVGISDIVGSPDGVRVGGWLGSKDGNDEGVADGCIVGSVVGRRLGKLVGINDGGVDGSGVLEGSGDGNMVGRNVGVVVGKEVGWAVVGNEVGAFDGDIVGTDEGAHMYSSPPGRISQHGVPRLLPVLISQPVTPDAESCWSSIGSVPHSKLSCISKVFVNSDIDPSSEGISPVSELRPIFMSLFIPLIIPICVGIFPVRGL